MYDDDRNALEAAIAGALAHLEDVERIARDRLSLLGTDQEHAVNRILHEAGQAKSHVYVLEDVAFHVAETS